MQSADSNPPTLTYAEPSTNELPDWFDAVEQMLDRREPVWKLSAMFPKSMDAVNYVIRSLARRFPADRVGAVCESCGRPCDTMAVIWWRVRIAAKMQELTRSTNSAPSESMAPTHHALCESCHRQAFQRKPSKPRVSRGGVAAVVLAVLAQFAFGIMEAGDAPKALAAGLMVAGIILIALSAGTARCRVAPAITGQFPADVPPVAVGPLTARPTIPGAP